MNEPQADYTPCPGCEHPSAYHCPIRGCQAILETGFRDRIPNLLCECKGPE